MAFPKQEYLSELPFPSPGHLPDPGIETASPALAGRFFTTEETPFVNFIPQYFILFVAIVSGIFSP